MHSQIPSNSIQKSQSDQRAKVELAATSQTPQLTEGHSALLLDVNLASLIPLRPVEATDLSEHLQRRTIGKY